MGTKEEEIAETQRLQSEIKDLLEKLNWSVEDLSKALGKTKIWVNINPESLKKQLARSSTSFKLLSKYLESIKEHEEVKKAGIIIPFFYKTGLFPDDKTDFMLEVSKAATKLARSTIETKTHLKNSK